MSASFPRPDGRHRSHNVSRSDGLDKMLAMNELCAMPQNSIASRRSIYNTAVFKNSTFTRKVHLSICVTKSPFFTFLSNHPCRLTRDSLTLLQLQPPVDPLVFRSSVKSHLFHKSFRQSPHNILKPYLPECQGAGRKISGGLKRSEGKTASG